MTLLFVVFFPIKIYDDLTNNKNLRLDLHRVGGVYGIVNVSNSKKIKQYIGSSKDLYLLFSFRSFGYTYRY